MACQQCALLQAIYIEDSRALVVLTDCVEAMEVAPHGCSVLCMPDFWAQAQVGSKRHDDHRCVAMQWQAPQKQQGQCEQRSCMQLIGSSVGGFSVPCFRSLVTGPPLAQPVSAMLRCRLLGIHPVYEWVPCSEEARHQLLNAQASCMTKLVSMATPVLFPLLVPQAGPLGGRRES